MPGRHHLRGFSAGGLALTLTGLVISAYLTVVHWTARVTLACPAGGVVNCEKVTTGPYSSVAGVPLALVGLVYFAGALPLHAPGAWRSPHPVLRTGRLAFAAAGVAMVVWLVYVELFVVDAICLWCTAVHLVTVALFFVTGFGTALTAEPAELAEMGELVES